MKRLLTLWLTSKMPDDEVEIIIRYLVQARMTGWELMPPGYHKRHNPETKKKEGQDE